TALLATRDSCLGCLDDQHGAFDRGHPDRRAERQVRTAHFPDAIAHARPAAALHDRLAQDADLADVLGRALIELRKVGGLGMAALPVAPGGERTDGKRAEKNQLELPGKRYHE